MQKIRSLLLLSLSLFNTIGCSQTPKPDPYFRQIAEPNHDPTKKPKWHHEYFGYCQEHGVLTNYTSDQPAVEEWVETHNNQYHRHNGSLYWAKVVVDRAGDK